MKLASAMVDRALDQYEAEALPDNHPAVPKLSELFGNHTFFLDGNGLNIVEPAGSSQVASETWRVVKLASWKDTTQTSLTPHKPEPTNVVIEVAPYGPDEAA